jgi:hypothetical protein
LWKSRPDRHLGLSVVGLERRSLWAVDTQQLPPALSGVQNPNNGDAVSARFVEDQKIVEVANAPLAQRGELKAAAA